MRKKIISSIEVFIVVRRVSPSRLSLRASFVFSFGRRNMLRMVNIDASKVFLVQDVARRRFQSMAVLVYPKTI